MQFAAEQFHAQLWRNKRHKIIHNGVALGGEESVSGIVGGRGSPDQSGEPTHAHLHHRQ